VIRVLRSQLDHFHLVSTPIQDSGTARDRLAATIEETWDSAERLKARLQPRLLDHQQRSDELQATAERKVQNLSAIPSHQRANGLTNTSFLINGKADLAKTLHAKQEDAVVDGLDRMRGRKPIMRVTLTDDELADLGLRVSDGKLVGNVDREKLRTTVRARMATVDLVRKRGMENPTPEALIKRYLPDPPAENRSSDDEPER
jgi:hypothetical protein